MEPMRVEVWERQADGSIHIRRFDFEPNASTMLHLWEYFPNKMLCNLNEDVPVETINKPLRDFDSKWFWACEWVNGYAHLREQLQ